MVQGIDATYSLLDDQKQKRAAEVARRERKNEESDLLADLLVKGGMAIGNGLLEKKTTNFINSTEQRGLRRTANAADANVAYLEKIGTAMADHKGGRLDYMREVVTPLVTAEFNATTPDYREGQDPYNKTLQNRIMDVARERLRLFEEAEDIYKNKDMNNFGDRLDLLQNKYTDSNLSELAVSAVSNFGKSKEDLEMEQILDFKEFVDTQTEGTRGYYAAQLQDLVTAYKKTGDLALSSRFAQEKNAERVLPEATKEERYAFKTKITFQEFGSSTNKRLFIVKQKQRMDRSVEGPDGKPFWTDVEGTDEVRLYSEDPQFGLTEQEYVQAMYDSIGFADLISKYKIDKQQLNVYHERLQDAGISLIPRTNEELNTYLKITNQFLTENKSYFTEGQEKIQEAFIDNALKSGGEVDKLLSQISQADSELEETVEQLIKAEKLQPGTTVETYRKILSRRAAKLSAQITTAIMYQARQIDIESTVLDTKPQP